MAFRLGWGRTPLVVDTAPILRRSRAGSKPRERPPDVGIDREALGLMVPPSLLLRADQLIECA
jgi:hypothetical protein